MSCPSTVIICIKLELFQDLAFEAIHDESISRVLNILEKNSEEAEIDKDGNRMFYLSEVMWYGTDVERFVKVIKLRPDDHILFEHCWDYPDTERSHGCWNDSPWNPGWDAECGVSYVGH